MEKKVQSKTDSVIIVQLKQIIVGVFGWKYKFIYRRKH